MLKVLFGSEARVKILALFMVNPAVDFYLREIAKRTGLPVRAVERTVKGLVDIGLLQREHRGNSVYFSVNREFPILPELKAIILKTVGLGGRLREVLSEEEGVKAAFIYGSYAKNQEDLESDVDLFVVGSISPRALTPSLARGNPGTAALSGTRFGSGERSRALSRRTICLCLQRGTTTCNRLPPASPHTCQSFPSPSSHVSGVGNPPSTRQAAIRPGF